MTAALFIALGAAAGLGQAALLARDARGGTGAGGVLLRLLLTGAALLLAATRGHLLAAAAGWAAGFAAGTIGAARRTR